MTRMIEAGGFRRIRVALLAMMFASRSASVLAQDGQPSIAPLTDDPPIADSGDVHTNRKLPRRFRKIEDRLERVTKQNEQLLREVRELRLANQGRNSDADTMLPNLDPGGGSARRCEPSGIPPAKSGGSASGGGDPTKSGSAQLIGNNHLGRSPLLGGSYGFENDGFRWSTQGDEITLGFRVLQQIDARIYANSNQQYASSCIFNPRTRFYFECNLTRPVSNEFSLQHTYSTTNLLDSYINYRFGDGLQLRFGRFKTPFDYEWYRLHIWQTLAPERSPFAENFGGNRRFGFAGRWSLFDNRLEYAVGTFNGQRNGFTPINSHQDVMVFLNFKPFDQDPDSILRNLQIGGALDAGPTRSRWLISVSTGISTSTSRSISTGSMPCSPLRSSITPDASRLRAISSGSAASASCDPEGFNFNPTCDWLVTAKARQPLRDKRR